MDIEKLIDGLKNSKGPDNCHDCALGYWSLMGATALSTLQTENEKLRAELERVKRERGAAIADWQGFCAKCVWNGKQYLSDGKMDDRCKTCRDNNKCNWEWRGIKED